MRIASERRAEAFEASFVATFDLSHQLIGSTHSRKKSENSAATISSGNAAPGTRLLGNARVNARHGDGP